MGMNEEKAGIILNVNRPIDGYFSKIYSGGIL